MLFHVFQSLFEVLERCFLPLSRFYVTAHPNNQSIYRLTHGSHCIRDVQLHYFRNLVVEPAINMTVAFNGGTERHHRPTIHNIFEKRFQSHLHTAMNSWLHQHNILALVQRSELHFLLEEMPCFKRAKRRRRRFFLTHVFFVFHSLKSLENTSFQL